MPIISEAAGYFASTLVLLTFIMKDMRMLRVVAIFSNVAFIAYGILDWLLPVLILHLVLLPLNVLRLKEIRGKEIVLANSRRALIRPVSCPPYPSLG
jgi:CRP/FNR family transcriptional regulator, cyclic AMP receptor protein